MKNVIMTNRDQIAGLPALCVRQFLADCEEPFSAKVFQSWLLLDDKTAIAAFQHLIADGYLQTGRMGDGTVGLIKTGKTLRLMQVATEPPLSHKEGYNVVLRLFWEIEQININPSTAHRIKAVKLMGQILIGAVDELPFVEVEILITPNVAGYPQIQREWGKIAAEYAEHSDRRFASDEEHENWSLQMIKDRLYDVHCKLCLRFV